MKSTFKIIALLLLGITLYSNQAKAYTTFPAVRICPIDGDTVIFIVTINYRPLGATKDFQKQGGIGNLYEDLISSCRRCHFSGYKEDFDTTFSAAAKAEILRILAPYKKAEMDDVMENEIAAKMHLYTKDKNDEIANIYLIASYYLRGDSARNDKRIEMQKEAINYFLKAVEKKEYDKEKTYATIYYLLGELYRRTADFSNAMRYFDKVLKEEGAGKWVIKAATDQKNLAIRKNADNDI